LKLFINHMMLLQDSQLNELELGAILEPDSIPFSFDTLGWKIVLVVLILLCIYVMYRLFVKYKNNQYKRDAIAEIEELIKNSEQPENIFIAKVLFVLKRTALQSYSRMEVASLQGNDWLSFLDKRASGVNFMQYKDDIANAIYRDTFDPETDFNKDEFSRMTLKWIKNHA